MEDEDIKRIMTKSYLMIVGIIGFIFCITYTVSGGFSEVFGTNSIASGEFDFGTNLGVALSIGFLLLFIATVAEITPRMVEKEKY